MRVRVGSVTPLTVVFICNGRPSAAAASMMRRVWVERTTHATEGVVGGGVRPVEADRDAAEAAPTSARRAGPPWRHRSRSG